MKQASIIAATVLMLALAGCPRPVPYAGTQTVPDIDILETRPVDRAYREVGIISVQANDPQARTRLAAKARALGADAVVIIGTSRRNVDVAVPDISSGVATRATVPLVTVNAVAIRYIDETQTDNDAR